MVGGRRDGGVVSVRSGVCTFPPRRWGAREEMCGATRQVGRVWGLTGWSGARSTGEDRKLPAGARFGNRLVAGRVTHVAVDPDRAFAPIAGIGGERGWYYAMWLWRLRGAIDLLIGGVGMRRGRRDPNALTVGDTVDFWRVDAYEPGRRLRLAAEMKLPGRAWLEFDVEQDANGTLVHQTAVFDPVGLSGLLYWYALAPVHAVLFRGLLRAIVRRASAQAVVT